MIESIFSFFKRQKCKWFGHNFIYQNHDQFPTSRVSVAAGYGGGSIGIWEHYRCSVCDEKEEVFGKWD